MHDRPQVTYRAPGLGLLEGEVLWLPRKASWRGWLWSFLIGGTMALVAIVCGL